MKAKKKREESEQAQQNEGEKEEQPQAEGEKGDQSQDKKEGTATPKKKRALKNKDIYVSKGYDLIEVNHHGLTCKLQKPSLTRYMTMNWKTTLTIFLTISEVSPSIEGKVPMMLRTLRSAMWVHLKEPLLYMNSLMTL